MRACDEEDHPEDHERGAEMQNDSARGGSKHTQAISDKPELGAVTRYQKSGTSLAPPSIMPQPPSVQRSKPPQLAQDESTVTSRQAEEGMCKSPEHPQSFTTKISRKDVSSDTKEFCKPIHIPPCISEEDARALRDAPDQPPVTKASLRELDLRLIQSNINLRVDINYDQDLHFTPVSGQKGEKKKLEALLYWQSLVAEFRIMYHNNFVTNCIECNQRCAQGQVTQRNFRPRLPGLFINLKDLLTILVPDRDQDQISQFLDISLLVQMASRGVLNVVPLSRWLCELLTTHCAPMRDLSAQEMAERVKEGAETGDMTALVDGVKKLFDFLEAMKLDVANHQIRSFRFHLIEDTVPFQKDHFRIRIQNRKFNVDEPREWFFQNVKSHLDCQAGGKLPSQSPLASLLHGLVEICLSNDPIFPETLKHDTSRLQTKRDQIQDIIHINICLDVFDNQIDRLVGGRFNPSCLHPILETRIKELQTRILDLTDGHLRPGETMAEMWAQHDGEIALELTNAAFSVCKRVGCVLPDSDIETTREQLSATFLEERANTSRARHLAQTLENKAQAYAHRFQSMTTLAISEAQRRSANSQCQNQHENQQWRQMPCLDEIARSLAHVAVIHMRVWSDLVYFPDVALQEIGVEDKEEDMHDEDCV